MSAPRRARGLGEGLTVRRGGERGQTVSDWLDSRQTFAFGVYDRIWSGLGPLKVLNEDRIQPGRGFGPHPHWDMEILTWVLEGTLAHRDSRDDFGAQTLLRTDEVQCLSAGTGIEHSEHNASDVEALRLFQIWIVPAVKGLSPGHRQRTAAPQSGLTLLASGAADHDATALHVHQDVALYAGQLPPGATRDHAFASGQRGWLQVADGTLAVDDLTLAAGDGVAIIGRPGVRLAASTATRFLLVDLG